MRRLLIVAGSALLLAGCFTTTADFKNDAEDFILGNDEMRNELGYRFPELVPGCTGCGACLLVCPDFCFEVFQYREPVAHVEGA